MKDSQPARAPLGRPRRMANGCHKGLIGLLTATLLFSGTASGQDVSTGELDRSRELRVVKVGSAERSFHVVATLIVGPTESVLWDSQYKVSDGVRVAERIAATGTTLKAVVLSHADHDHYMGATAVLERFPETPVYMTRTGLDDFAARSQDDLAWEKQRGQDSDVPDILVRPKLLPTGPLYVDGHELIVIGGLTGDVRAPASAALWIPSIRTVLTGDLVFEGIHPWLGDSDMASRTAWKESLRRLAGLDPNAVVPGHKRDLATPDSPVLIDSMIRYLNQYDAAMEVADKPEDVVGAMVAKYPDLALPGLMAYGAKKWFKQ